MPTRVYFAFDLTRSSGPGDQDGLLDALEEDMPEVVDLGGETVYDVKVLGVGRTIKDLQESMRLRRENEKRYG